MEGDQIITVTQQPSWISDEDIAELLHDAHKTTLEAGMHYAVLKQNGKDIRKRLGSDGVFFVAVTADKQLLGVSGISFYDKYNRWFTEGKPCAEVKLEGVRDSYKGKGINGMIHKAVYEYAYERVDLLVTHTAQQNSIVIRNDLNRGWHVVDYDSWKATDYYSIILAKWKDGCPFSEQSCRLHFLLRKYRTKLIKNRYGQYRMPICFFRQKLRNR